MFDYLFLSAALALGPADPAGTDAAIPAPFAFAPEAAAGPADTSAPPGHVLVPAPLLPPPAEAKEEAEAAEAATPADRWFLMRCLQGTAPGYLLDGHRMQIYGWTSMSFTASSATDLNTPVVWNYQANQYLLQQHWVRFERSVVTSGTSEPTFGFRSDWLFGSDYVFTLPRGIFNGQLTANDGLPNYYGVDPIAFYAEAYFPTVAQGLDVKVGRWFTPFGVESLEAVSTPLVSRSYAFNWAPPFTHTGVFATLTLTPIWRVQGGFALGNDIFIDPADEPRFVGTVSWTQPGGRNAITFGTSLGRGKFNDVEAFNNINVFDVVYTHTFNSVLTYTYETIYGYQTNVPDIGVATWGSIVNYLTYTLSPRLASVSRLEFFDDFQGSRTGFPGLYSAVTTGLTFQPCSSVIIRPELRYDYNGESQPFEGKNWLITAAADLTIRW